MLTQKQADERLNILNVLNDLGYQESTSEIMRQVQYALEAHGWNVKQIHGRYVFVEVSIEERTLQLAARMDRVEETYSHEELSAHELELFEELVRLLASKAQLEDVVEKFLSAYGGAT